MNTKKTKIILTLMLLLAFGNYARMHGTEDIRTVEFLSIFAIGALSALLIREIFSKDPTDD